MGNFKNLTLLHSNDMHGDFFSSSEQSSVIGGISLLSGYVNKVRREVPNVLYCIAGDMLQGSLIDAEYQGISTIEIMNMLEPDVACIGNHEVDYGLAHLLFLERCATFPILNANLFVKNPPTRLFTPQVILRVDGMKIMFIGITTEEIIHSIKRERLLGSFIDIYEAAREVGRICNAYRTTDIDLTVLLTHIGFEEDKKLAALLDPEWGVDVIIGGHSHTVLEQPEIVNDIYIVQAGMGTAQIGRFDIVVDTDNNTVHDYTWELVPIDAQHCPRNEKLEEILTYFQERTDDKYGSILCHLADVLKHPSRYQETELGNFFADILLEMLDIDLMLLGSGSIRKLEAGPIITHGDLMELMPYDEEIYRLKATGAQLKQMMLYMLREEALAGQHTEFFQLSKGIEIVYNREQQAFEEFNLNGAPIEDDKLYAFGLPVYHYANFATSLGLPIEDILAHGKALVLTTSLHDVIGEFFQAHHPKIARVEGRLVIKNNF